MGGALNKIVKASNHALDALRLWVALSFTGHSERQLSGRQLASMDGRLVPIVLKNSVIFLPFCGLNFDLNFILLISQISKIRFDDSTTPIVFMPELIHLSVLQVLTI